MSGLRYSESIVVARSPEALYDMVSDVTRMGEWSPVCKAVDAGTEVTESWEFLPDGLARFHDQFGDDAPARITNRTEAAHKGIPITLAAIKQAAESA